LTYDNGVQRFREALLHVGLRMEPNGAVVRDARLVAGKGIEYERCAARVLSMQPQWRCREEAIKRFEALERSDNLNTDDRYILAHLYEAKNDWPRTREQLNRIALSEDRQIRHLTAFAQILLRNGDKEEALAMIKQVEAAHKARPSMASEVALEELQARWLEANREGDKAVALLRARVERKDTDVKEVLLLVASLGRQQRFAEALDLLERIWKCPPEMAGGTSVALLRSAQALGVRNLDTKTARVAQLLEEAIKKEPKNANLRIQLGDVYDTQGDYVKAEKCYEAALGMDRDSLLALNNLAWLLAQRSTGTGKASRALELVNRAIAVYGPRGELLDTRAVVYLALKRPAEARADLDEALKDVQTPTRYFHLARAYYLAGDRKAAARELRRATELGLKPDHLHPAEQAQFPRLFEDLKSL
jgi:tetratricopeptide (TPR) repeat protein